MRLSIFVAVVSLAVGIAYQAPAHADELDRYLERQRQVYQIPAIVVGVIRGGQLVDSRAVGLANVELSVPATSQHVFEIGSISKQFTAYAILMLYEQGKVDLRAPVGRYLTGLPEPWGAPTLHQLMSHTSGLPDFEEAFDYGVYREMPSDDDFLKRLLDLKIEATYRRRGTLQSVAAVGPDGVQDTKKPTDRLVFENMTRVITFEFDEEGRMKSIRSEDE